MVIDTSALIAILLNETKTEAFAKAIASDPKRLISAFNLFKGRDFALIDIPPALSTCL